MGETAGDEEQKKNFDGLDSYKEVPTISGAATDRLFSLSED